MRLFRHVFVKKKGMMLLLSGLCIAFIIALNPLVETVQTQEPVKADGALNGIIVFVDAGHGGYDGGARARDSGIWEKEINLSVAKKTQAELVKRGATVLMSREEDVDLCDDGLRGITRKRSDLKHRLEIATKGNANFVLSIHMNEYRDRRESGPHVFFRKNQDASRLLAGCMQQALIQSLTPARRRVARSGDYYMLSLDSPSILIECGFLSNAQEEKLLLTPAYQQKIADSIVDGLISYLSLASR